MNELNPYSAPTLSQPPSESSAIHVDVRQIALVNVYLYGLVYFITFLYFVSYFPIYVTPLTRITSAAADVSRFWWYVTRIVIYLLASSQIILHAGAIVDGMLARARSTAPGHLTQEAGSADLHAIMVMFIRLTALSYIVVVLDELTWASSYSASFENVMHFGKPTIEAVCYAFRVIMNTTIVVVLYRMAPAIAVKFSRKRSVQPAEPNRSQI